MINGQLQHRIRTAGARARNSRAVPAPLVGAEIFTGTDYPSTWGAFVGQDRAKAQLKAACYSARREQRRMDHVLLASGVAGIGKTSIAKLIAADLETGIVEVSGQVTIDDVRPILQGMLDNDVLFIDEIHQLVSGGKTKAEWLLHLLQDGNLVTKSGVEVMPRVTIIGATTDAQKLPTTILGRFPVKPVLDPYTVDEATLICHNLAARLGFGKGELPYFDDLAVIAKASNGNPRDMRSLLIALRDTFYASSTFDLSMALDWTGVTEDGLNRMCQDYLSTLLVMCEGKAGLATIGSAMGEPGPLKHTEQTLIQKGYVLITPSGREMTESGVERTTRLLKEKGLLDDEPEYGSRRS